MVGEWMQFMFSLGATPFHFLFFWVWTIIYLTGAGFGLLTRPTSRVREGYYSEYSLSRYAHEVYDLGP